MPTPKPAKPDTSAAKVAAAKLKAVAKVAKKDTPAPAPAPAATPVVAPTPAPVTPVPAPAPVTPVVKKSGSKAALNTKAEAKKVAIKQKETSAKIKAE